MAIYPIVFGKNDKKLKFFGIGYGKKMDDTVGINDAIRHIGGKKEDYLVYHIEDASEDYNRLLKQDDCEAILENGKIIGIDFSKEDSKKSIKFWTDNSENRVCKYDDGTCDDLFISAEVLTPDGERDTTFNGSLRFPIAAPSQKMVEVEINFVDGFKTHKFLPNHYGVYQVPVANVPRPLNDSNMRISNHLLVNVYRKV